jgi:hypothetical protein
MMTISASSVRRLSLPTWVWGSAFCAVALVGAAPAVATLMPVSSSSAPAANTPAPLQNVDANDAHHILVMLRLPPPRQRLGSAYAGAYGDSAAQAARSRLARSIARRHQLVMVDNWPMPAVALDCFVMQAAAGTDMSKLIAALAQEPAVELVQPVQTFEALGAGQSFPAIAANHNLPSPQQWRLADLHKVATGKGASVAIIDSQIARQHPDLAGQIHELRDFTGRKASGGEHHGTAVAGVIAARAGNAGVMAGVAPSASVHGLRACWEDKGAATRSATVCDSFSLAKAMLHALDTGADIINLSLAGPNDPLLARILDVAATRRIWIVAARHPTLPGGGFPASHRGVVVATDHGPGTSARGFYMAPGRDILTTTPGGWGLVTGSSFAAAHLTGLLALVRSVGQTGSDGASHLVLAGLSTVDSCATLASAARRCVCSCTSSDRSRLPVR